MTPKKQGPTKAAVKHILVWPFQLLGFVAGVLLAAIVAPTGLVVFAICKGAETGVEWFLDSLTSLIGKP